MAQAAGAGHEDHRRRRDRADLASVVAGAGDDAPVGVAKVARGGFDRGDAVGVELDRRLVPDLVEHELGAVAAGALGDDFAQVLRHVFERLAPRMTDIDGEKYLARNRVARVRRHLHFADRADRLGRVVEREALHRGNDLGGREQGIAPASHRRRAGVRIAPPERKIVPANALAADDDADGLVLGLENRPLLDVRLEQRADRMLAAGLVAEVADAPEFVAEGLAVGIRSRPRVLLVEQPGVDARRDHRRGEARALLVGPDDDLERRGGRDVVLVQGAQDFEPGEHAVDAVEAAAVRLGVEVAAGDDRRARIVAAGPAREDVAHVVDLDRAAYVAAPADEQIAALAVGVGQRQAARATMLARADFGHRHDAVPESPAINS